MSRRAAKVDQNQSAVVDTLRAIGAKVHIASALGDGFTDLVVGYRGRVWLIEVKDENQPPSARALTPKQKEFHREWQGYCYVANSPREALMIIGAWVPILEGAVA